MTDSTFSVLWIAGGLMLMLLELLLPGSVVLFVGLAAVLVGCLLYAGILDGPFQALITWFVGSIGLLLGLRGFLMRFFPSSMQIGDTDEDVDAYDQIASVAESIPPGGEGRIHFRGTTWLARSYQEDRELARDTRVRLITRDNLVWIVEPLEEDAADESSQSDG